MQQTVLLLGTHELLAVFVVTLLGAAGIPLPVLPVLLLAGAHAAGGTGGWFGIQALAVAVLASMIPATAWFLAGRRFGRGVLALLCRISISPDTCVRKNEISFARRGPVTLLVSKFVPGLSMLASPVAGALGMRMAPFLVYRTAGTALWAAAGIAAGMIFGAQISLLLAAIVHLGGDAARVGAILAAVYLGWRLWARRAAGRVLAQIDWIESGELAACLEREPRPVIIDVRSLVSRPADMRRVPGALNIDLASLDSAPLHEWPAAAQIVTYCDCPNDVSAAKAAQLLTRRGRSPRVLAGGLGGWEAAGYPVEKV